MNRGDAPVPDRAAARLAWGGAAAVFLARAWLIRAFGPPLPFWDQWDAEGLGLYLPWVHGTFAWSRLWTPHNEHRIVLTQLQNLLLFLADGRWDPLLQLTVNAAWHALIAALLIRLLLAQGTAGRDRAAAGFVVLVLAAPFGWQNALWGFQSQVYFALLAAILSYAGLGRCAPGSPGWCGGLAAGAAGLVANATGVIGAGAVLVTLAARRALGGGRPRADLIGLAAAGALVAAGLAAAVPAPQHAYLHAASAGVFARALASSLAWPAIDQPALAPLLWLPWLLACARLARRPRELAPADALVLFLGAYAALNAAATAYARGQGLPDFQPLSRYQDALALGAIANFAALLRGAAATPAGRRAGRILALAWVAAFGLGLARLTYVNAAVNLPFLRASGQAQVRNLTAYLRTGDAGALAGRNLFEIGHTNPAVLRRFLDDPAAPRVLPPALQPEGAARSLPEQAVRGLLRASPALALAAGGLFGWLALRPGRRRAPEPAPP